MTFAKLLHENFTLIQYLEFFARIIVACVCGFLIGFERTKRFKEAGIRTHVIVCCAAALMMIISKYGFADLVSGTGALFAGTKEADPSRIASQIVSGVSFLGAGVIFHSNNGVKGLTTAAGIWATAGIGMAIGSGMYIMGAVTTILIFMFQWFVHKHDIGGDQLSTSQLRFTVKNTDAFRKEFMKYIDSKHGQIVESKIKFNEDGYASYNVTIRTTKEITIDDLNAFLEDNSEVKSVTCVSMNQ